jgi:hypothetical protein
MQQAMWLLVAGNLGAVGGIISGSMDVLRRGYKFGTARSRNNAFDDALGHITEPALVTKEGTEKRTAAIEHIKKLNRKKQWAGAGQAASDAMIAAGGALSATGVGAVAGTGLMLAGMALQSAPGAYRGAKQFFRNNAEAKRTMSHNDWKSMQNARIAENKKRAQGPDFGTRAYAGMQWKRMRIHKWWNQKGWGNPTHHDGRPQSYKEWTQQKKAAYNQRTGPTGWGSSAIRLGRWAHHNATLTTTSNWDKSDKKKKATHVEHATTLLGQDDHDSHSNKTSVTRYMVTWFVD